MQKILLNLALFMMIDHCRANGIDCAGTHVIKPGRGYTYDLVQAGRSILSVKFHKSQRPVFMPRK